MIANLSEDLFPNGHDRIGWNLVALIPRQSLRRFKHCRAINWLRGLMM